MCGCEDSFVCSRCAGDPRQDYRMAFQRDEEDEAKRDLYFSQREEPDSRVTEFRS